eukprot:TRINITY_DN594_c0_g1_i9.p1 TRINITY_DN594_c0_g1~~TRINITY_DN594_c0_g1_i9.p1  ORF type:complete len:301 (+),score=74.54 TRINITY_DN594_c0_g1_i9:67-969(+)
MCIRDRFLAFFILLGLITFNQSNFIEDILFNQYYRQTPAHNLVADEPVYTITEIEEYFGGKKYITTGYLLNLANPIKHFSIQVNPAGCSKRQPVLQTAAQVNCKVATNGGFFSMSTGDCIGAIVVDGQIISKDRIGWGAFGLDKSGNYYIGYLTKDTDYKQFDQLIQGLGWIVKDGKNNVAVAAKAEAISDSFVNALAARVLLGYDKDSNLLLMSINGYAPGSYGLTLNQLADFAIQKGFVQALNLDGGGSVTFAENGKMLNSCSDSCGGGNVDYKCKSPFYSPGLAVCARFVTSITCIK